MCDIKDAKRHEKLAGMYETENNVIKARLNYLEAASIYVLQAEVSRKDELIDDANRCYQAAHTIIGNHVDNLTKQELARCTLIELDEMYARIQKRLQKNRIGGDSMCGEHKIMSLVEIAKKMEDNEPEHAAKSYLEAADELLKESTEYPDREHEYIELANKMYEKAKQLKTQQVIGDEPWKPEPVNVVDNSTNKITFADIGGLEELKQEIGFKIIEPLKNPDLFKFYGKAVGGGILMYGPPGCGKSLIAMATAHEADASFIHVKSSDLKSKFVGETEKNIAELFKKAREAQPSIIFFDEFEALGGDRSEGQAHERSAVAQLLTEMDGMEAKDQQILLLAATNEPWAIDPALRREGRFGNTLFIPQPDFEARKQIFEINMKERPIKELDYEMLARVSDGFSGADIKAACEIATDIPLKESFQTGNTRHITMDDMEKGIAATQSVMKQWFEKARQQVEKKKLQDSFKDLVEKSVELEKEVMVL